MGDSGNMISYDVFPIHARMEEFNMYIHEAHVSYIKV